MVGYMFPIQILLFCTVICYSVINPLILLPGVIYFGAAWMVYKNQLIYVYVKEVESYGAFWKMAYTRSLMGLYAFQFVTAGLLSAKRANYQAILCGLLVPCTVIFQILCSSIFSRHLKYLPLDQCDDQPFPTAAPGQKSLSYQSPAFSKRLRTVWVPEYIAHLVTPEIDAAFSESAKKSVSQRGLIPIFQI